jgi:5-methylcytosine-specific restriction endonuclease McrA
MQTYNTSSAACLALDRHPALVLNPDGRPTKVPFELMHWHDAVRGVINERLNVISHYDIVVRSPSMEVRLPSIVMNRGYIDLDVPAAFNRWNVLLAHEFNCGYCSGPASNKDGNHETAVYHGSGMASKSPRSKTRFQASDLTFDHVIPRSRGGATNWLNIVPACRRCNEMKANRTPSEARMALRFKPYVPTRARLNTLALIHVVDRDHLHQSWQDYLYWDSNIDQ